MTTTGANAPNGGEPTVNGRNVIAIDGPAGSGKTTIAVLLAARLGAVYLDTGLLYRAATWLALERGWGTDDGARLASAIDNGAIMLRPATVHDGRHLDVLVFGDDVTADLRTPRIDRAVSAYSALPEVRAALLPVQRAFARNRKVIMVGRDIATTVFPDARVQIYLDASVQERARRRYRELQATGSSLTLADVEADLIRRDAVDSSRAASPLAQASGAIRIDTDGKGVSQVVDEVSAAVTDGQVQ
jgi:cytidylate kinase